MSGSESFPLVSIAIPSFNYAHFVDGAIRSATAQTYQNLEIVVIDNASTDNSVEVIAKLAAIDPRIRYTVNPTNVGMHENFRLVREACKGEYLVFLSADDILFPHHISAAIEYYRTHPECDLRHTGFALINEFGEIAEAFDHPGHRGIRSISAREELGYALVADGHYMFPSIVFPRRVLDAIGPFPTHVVAGDMEYMFRANRAGFRIAFDGSPSTGYRRHPGGASSRENHIQTGKHLHDWLTLYDENLLPETLPRLVGRRRSIIAMIESRVRPLQMYAPQRAEEIFERERELFARVRAKAEAIPDKLDAASAPYPRFSIVLPTMSALGQLKRSIDSVGQQTESSWELIVVSNDGRNIEGVLHYFMDPKRLVYLETSNNGNAANARNMALRIARGETIAYLDEGDSWHPRYLEMLGRALDGSGADFVRSGASLALYDALEFGPGNLLLRDESFFAPAASQYVDAYGFYAPLSAIAHRSYLREVVGTFNETLALLEDWEIAARLVSTPNLRGVDLREILVESAYYRGLAQQTLGNRIAALPRNYQAVSSTLRSDPSVLAARAGEIVTAANTFLADKGNIEHLLAFIRSISGFRKA
ncbi:MAG TPA: glycosyltransferase [Candidatus Acidoferrales bacterium]|nr:glycosyltransferase [Candidatus Acidoferrales bacterium]